MAASVPGPRPTRRNAPHGEDAVRTALIEAAAGLFASRGPSHVSVREIATRAGVNHGLVHHYFGSKDGLVAAVLQQLAADATAEVVNSRAPATLSTADGPSARHGRIVAHLILEGRDPGALKTSFPSMDALVARFRAAGLSARAARERAAQILAVVLGWQLFEPFLAAAAQLPTDDRHRGELLEDAVRKLSQS